MKTSQRLAKNVLFGGLGATISSLMQFAAILMIVRFLSVDQFGIYTLLIAFVTALQQFGELGMGSILIRDLAIDPKRISELFGDALSLEWLVSAIVVLAMCLFIPLLHLRHEVALAAFIMGLSGLWCIRANLYGALFRSQEENELQAIGFVLYGVAHFTLVLMIAKFWPSLIAVSSTYLMANVIQVVFYRLIATRRYARPTLRPSLARWKYLLVSSVPIGAAGMTRTLGEQSDFVILARLTNLRTVGLYSGAYKLIVGLRFATQPIVFALLPLYSRASIGKRDFSEIYERSIRAFLLIACPVAALFFVAPKVLAVGFLGSHYADGATVTRLLGIAACLFVLEAPFPALFTAINEQRFLMLSSVSAVILRVVLNLAAIPFLGIRGPCLAVALSEGVMLALWLGRLRELGFTLRLAKLAWRPLIVSLVMGAILYRAHVHSLPWLVTLAAVFGLIYLAVVIKLGGFSEAELEMAREGLGFFRPFLAQWSWRPLGKP